MAINPAYRAARPSHWLATAILFVATTPLLIGCVASSPEASKSNKTEAELKAEEEERKSPPFEPARIAVLPAGIPTDAPPSIPTPPDPKPTLALLPKTFVEEVDSSDLDPC